jgi:hypothetical protein
MYGMVNQAIKEMVLEKFDETTWDFICQRANLKLKSFAPFEQYDDAITGNLVSIISDIAKMNPTDLLEAFGEYWILYAHRSEYSSILESFATSPVELIESLDNLHSRLELMFTNLKAPSFWVEHSADREILVHYTTVRDMPLEFFVVGLLKGIFRLFKQDCKVTMLPAPEGEKGLFKVNF